MTGRIPARTAKLAVSLVVIGAVFAAIAGVASAAATVVYSNIPKPLPGNVQSLGFEATSTAEFGGQIEATGAVKNPTVTIGMSSWACQSGSATDDSCSTTPGATFNVPITLNVYSVGPGNSVGAKLLTVTQNFAVPYRPSANTTKCPGNGGWYKMGNCFHGKLFKLKFAKLGSKKAPVEIPQQSIVSVAFNTQAHGYAPTGVEGPYNSLNVAYLNSTWSEAYCDGGAGGTGTFRLDSGCWTGYQPMIEVKASETVAEV